MMTSPSAAADIVSDGVIHLPDSGERAPLCVLWTTLPGISQLLPVIGHMGISDSSGISVDFSGPYQVTVGSLMCGPAKRIWQLQEDRIMKRDGKYALETYDAAVVQGACVFGKKMHRIVVQNCHSHVAFTLNQMQYDGRSDWNQLRVFLKLWTEGKWVSKRDAVYVFLPFVIVVGIIVVLPIVISKVV